MKDKKIKNASSDEDTESVELKEIDESLENHMDKKISKKDNFSIKGNLKNLKNQKYFMKGFGLTGVIVLALGSLFALILYILIIGPALSLMVNVNALKRDLGEISHSLTSRDLVELEKAMSLTENDLDRLSESRDKKFGWARNMKLFKAKEFYEDSERFIKAGHLTIGALRETSRIVTPFADAAGLRISEEQEVVQEEGLMEAFQSWVSIMPEVATQMDGVLGILTEIGEVLAPIETAKYPEQFRGSKIRENVEFAKKTLINAKEYAPDIKQALIIIPSLLGVDSPIDKRYMIIMQNDKEIRPTGGFWTNYATFKIRDGLLQSDFSSNDFYSIDYAIDVIDAYFDFPDAPVPYGKYLKVERWYARDTNSSPDFPTSVDNFMFYYNLGIKYAPSVIKPIDGIITIDTQVLEELMEITGPVTVNGLTYNTDNVVLELERIASLNVREQINRKGVLGDLMEAMLINLFESDVSIWSSIIDKMVDLGIRKHIQGYSFNEEAQVLIEKYNLGGRIADPVEGDYSMVVQTNLGGDKTNWFTHKKVEHILEKEGERWVRTEKITYTYSKPGDEYGPFTNRFRDWVRVYTPSGSELISINGSEDETGVGEERNKTYFSGYLELGPGETKTIEFKYYLPENVIGDSVYNLLIQKQAGILEETHVVTVNGQSQELNLRIDKRYTEKL